MEPIALIPEVVEIAAPGVVVYGDADPTHDELAACGFFVPRYMGAAPNTHLMSAMPRLEVCQLLTAGFDQALELVPDGVKLCNAIGVHDASTAELAIGLMLTSRRAIDDAVRAMQLGSWDHRSHSSLADARVLVIGAGGVGRAIRDRLMAFEVSVQLVGRTARSDIAGIDQIFSLLPISDIVVMATPLNPSTQRMVDAEFLSRMASGALLVNVSRGQVVDTEAILGEIGRLRFALDVTDPEPLPPGHPLWSSPGVIVTPHLGGNTSAFVPRARALVTSQIHAWQSGETLQGVVN